MEQITKNLMATALPVQNPVEIDGLAPELTDFIVSETTANVLLDMALAVCRLPRRELGDLQQEGRCKRYDAKGNLRTLSSTPAERTFCIGENGWDYLTFTRQGDHWQLTLNTAPTDTAAMRELVWLARRIASLMAIT